MGGRMRRRGPGRRSGRGAARQRVAVSGALAALAAVAAACGTSSTSTGATGSAVAAGSAAAAAAVRKASQVTDEAGSAAIAVHIQTNEQSSGTGRLGLALLGAFDLTTQRGAITMSVTGTGQGTPPSFHMVFAGGSLYLQATGALAGIGAGKPWVSLPPSSLSQLFAGVVPGSAAGPIAALVTGDPLAAVGMLDTADLTASAVGPRTVGGVAATEYDVTVDPVAAAKHATGSAKALFASLGTKPVTAQVWLDHQGRLVQLQALASGAPASVPAHGGTAAAPVGVTVDLSQFGSPVSITVPPPSQVTQRTGSGTASS